MSPTKVLTINPEFFSSKQGNNSKTMKKERKQKPAESKTTNSMRKALLAKIRDYQKREGEKIEENNKNQMVEKDPSFESEFNKSLNFLQEIANKHREKKHSKTKTFKRPPLRNPSEPFVNVDLPEALIDVPPVSVVERNSLINHQNLNNVPINHQINHQNINQNTFQPINFSHPSNVLNPPTRQTIDESVNLKPLIKNTTTVPVIQPQMSVPTPTQIPTPIPIQTQPIIPPQIIIDTEMPPVQPQPPLQPQENIKIEIKNADAPDLTEQVKLNVKKSLKFKNKSLAHNSHNVNRPSVATNIHNITIKNPPPYSNLKGGNKPTYREWNKTYKTHAGQPRLTIDENKNMKMTIPSKKLITRKTKTIKYNLGKKGKNINVLIKNNNTRKKIKQELMSLKRKPILEVKEYLHDKNLIKMGTLAPNDVLREIYEQSILSGDLVNENKQNLIHNFLNTKPDAF